MPLPVRMKTASAASFRLSHAMEGRNCPFTLPLRHPVRCPQERRLALGQRRYRSGEFARKTGVSVRTLRYYDAIGLLSPSERTDTGYRLYADEDLRRLQQILALRFLGFPLDEIARFLAAPQSLQTALAQQKAMLREWRQRLDRVVRAIEGAERLGDDARCDWDAVVGVIRAIQMEQNRDWTRKYFTEDQKQTMDELTSAAYADRAKQRLQEVHGGRTWAEEDQRRVDARYNALYAGVRRLVVAGSDPAGAEAQSLAADALQLEREFTGGDLEVAAALQTWWTLHAALPTAQQALPSKLTAAESDFLEQAKALARK